MSDSGTNAQATLDAWLEQRADRLNPIRFRFIEALAARAAGHDGEVRRMLDERLSQLLEAHASDPETARSTSEQAESPTASDTPARSALGGLIDYIASHAATNGNPTPGDTPPPPSRFPELEALDDFEKIWSKLRIDNQLRESLDQIPTDAGPLNSGSLVHRSLTLMQKLSPGYLQQFLSYVDALSWMEHMCLGGSLTARPAPRTDNPNKRPRGKSRERRD